MPMKLLQQIGDDNDLQTHPVGMPLDELKLEPSDRRFPLHKRYNTHTELQDCA
jgi:hypothetical protein